MKVTVNRDICMGAGSCKQIAPAVFDQHDEDGTVILLQEHPPLPLHDSVQQAARCCPSQAISVEGVKK